MEPVLESSYRCGGSVQLRLAGSATGLANAGGPDLTDAVEQYDEALVWRKTSTYTMPGPDGSDNAFEDSTEPYFLTPPDTSRWTTFQTGAADTTLTIGDGTTTTAAFTVGSEEVVVITATVSDDIDDDADLTYA